MPLGVDIGASADTLATTERTRGRVGPSPEDDRTEIGWGRLDGHDVVIKAGSGVLRDRLRREAEILRRVDGPPVVRLEELAEGADHTELVTRRFGSLTLAETGLLDPWECGASLVAFCDAIEMLHGTGWAHGSLDASHVLVDPGEGVELCSLGDASETDTAEGRTAVVADHDGLAGVVVEVLERPPGFDSPRVRRMWRRAARRAVPNLLSARGLRTPGQVREILSEAKLPGTERLAEPDSEPDSGSEPESGSELGVERQSDVERETRRDPKIRLLALALALAVVSGTAAWLAGAGPSTADTAPSCVDVDGDGSCDDVRVEGQEVSVNGRVYAVGSSGDLARLGDWNCDGRATVALLRPASGQVFVFDGWSPGEGRTIEAEFVGQWPEAKDIVEQSTCGAVQLSMEDGSTVDSSSGSAAERGD